MPTGTAPDPMLHEPQSPSASQARARQTQGLGDPKRATFPVRADTLLAGLLILIDVWLCLVFALGQSLHTPTFHVDGAFQTASGLFRLADGQWPGRDFLPYLGVGLLFAIYPIFLAAGGNLFASVFSANLAVLLGVAFSIGLLVYLSATGRRLLKSVVFATVTLLVALAFFDSLPYFLEERFTPGNSLRPLRALAPYLCALPAAWILASGMPRRVQFHLLAVVAALGFVWSTDFGLPTFVVMMAYSWGLAFSRGLLTPKSAAINLLAASASLLGLLTLATHGHPLAILEYTFYGVARDQYWYFGPWFPHTKILSAADLVHKLYLPLIHWWGVVPVVVGLLAFKTRSHGLGLLFVVGLVLLLGGIAPSVGGHVERGYFGSFYVWCTVVLMTLPVNLLLGRLEPLHQRMGSSARLVSRGLAVAFLGATVVLAASFQARYQGRLEATRADPDRYYVPEFGSYLHKAWKPYVDRALSRGQTPVLEEYWGLWSSVTRQQGLLPVDATIHVLGPKLRAEAARVLATPPDTIITSSIRTAGGWLGWNLSANWWLYRLLLSDYVPARGSPSTIVWRRADTPPQPWPSRACRIVERDGAPRLLIDAPAPGYYEVTLHFDRTKLSRRTLLMVQNNLNFARGADGPGSDGYLSLDTHARSSTFPVALLDRIGEGLGFRVVAATDRLSDVTFHGCSARELTFRHEEILPAPTPPAGSLHAMNFTDGEWIFGFARDGMSLLVEADEQARRLLVPGASLDFAGGLSRSIVSRRIEGSRMVLTLERRRTEAFYGYPRVFEVSAPLEAPKRDR